MKERVWSRYFLLICVFLLFQPFAAGAAPLTADLASLLDGMAARYWDNRIQAAFGTFTYEYSGLATPFSRWLEDELLTAAPQTERVSLFNRSAAAAMDPAFKDMYGDFFAVNQVGGLLAGKYFQETGGVRVRLELTSLRDGNLIDAREVLIPAGAIPLGLPVAPAESVLERAKVLASLAGSTAVPGGLSVSVSTDRGAGAVYYDGEKMTVFVSVNRDAYVKLYGIDAAGNTQLIWPNRFGGGDGFITAGAPVCLPGENDPFAFLLGAPYGTEFIKAVASTVPFATREGDFNTLSGDAVAVIKRGLVLVTEAPRQGVAASAAGTLGMAESLASYIIAGR